jgi:gluconolactonase
MSDNLTPRIEQLAPELEKIISTSEPIQHLADGFGGAQGPAEGPLWWEDGGYPLFSDIHHDRRMKYQPGSGVSLFLEPTNRANGLTRDLQGRLVACEHDSRRVTRQEADGSITVVANSFQGRQLNRPNDVVVKSLTSIIEPVILIVLGVLVGFVALSMFLPLFDLTAATGGGGGG